MMFSSFMTDKENNQQRSDARVTLHGTKGEHWDTVHDVLEFHNRQRKQSTQIGCKVKIHGPTREK